MTHREGELYAKRSKTGQPTIPAETWRFSVIAFPFGCDEIQSYYFSRPLPAGDFEEWRKNFSFKPRDAS